MRATERRQALLETLCERKHDKIVNLAFEFNVSRKTICRDIQELSISYPIYTITGRYGSGAYIDDDYYLGKQYLSEEQQSFLEKLMATCDEEGRRTLQTIVNKFGKTRRNKE